MSKRRPSEDPEITKTGLKRKVSSLFKKRPTRSILKKTKHEEQTGQVSSSKLFHLVNLGDFKIIIRVLNKAQLSTFKDSHKFSKLLLNRYFLLEQSLERNFIFGIFYFRWKAQAHSFILLSSTPKFQEHVLEPSQSQTSKFDLQRSNAKYQQVFHLIVILKKFLELQNEQRPHQMSF